MFVDRLPIAAGRDLVATVRTIADDADLDAADGSEFLVFAGLAVGVAFAVGIAVTLALRWLAGRLDVAVDRGRAGRSPVVAVFVLVALRIVLEGADADELTWVPVVARVLDIALIVTVGWILLVVARVIEKGALRQFPDTGLGDRHSRHARTKITLMRRVTDAVTVTIVVAAALWTIPAVREVGIGIFASAGVVGIVFGLAAQTSLSNIFAGIQIAFTDGIRIDDIVDIEGRWGRIEEITLTYVVVRVWDGTSLILPCTYFTTTPFLNWTHQGTSATGTVEIGVDWLVPVDELRDELGRVLDRSPHWNGVTGDLHVEDTSGPVVTLVAEVSSVDGDALAPLRRDVREGLMRFIQRQHADMVPRAREDTVTRLLPPEPETIRAYRALRNSDAADDAGDDTRNANPDDEEQET